MSKRRKKTRVFTERITMFDKRSKMIGRLTKLGLEVETIRELLANKGVQVTRSQTLYHGSIHAYGARAKWRKGQTRIMEQLIAKVLR